MGIEEQVLGSGVGGNRQPRNATRWQRFVCAYHHVELALKLERPHARIPIEQVASRTRTVRPLHRHDLFKLLRLFETPSSSSETSHRANGCDPSTLRFPSPRGDSIRSILKVSNTRKEPGIIASFILALSLAPLP